MDQTGSDQIHPDALRAAGEVLKQLADLGHTATLVHVEPYERDHYILNVDTTTEHSGSREGEQQALKQIDERTTQHAAEVAITVQEPPAMGNGCVFWELEGMIRITEDPKASV